MQREVDIIDLHDTGKAMGKLPKEFVEISMSRNSLRHFQQGLIVLQEICTDRSRWLIHRVQYRAWTNNDSREMLRSLLQSHLGIRAKGLTHRRLKPFTDHLELPPPHFLSNNPRLGAWLPASTIYPALPCPHRQ